jgi:hypothetical protein
MNFDVAGPFKINRYGKKSKIINDQSLEEFKGVIDSLKGRHEGLSDAIGCYVFAIRAGKGYTPYYVGQTCRQSLVKQALNPSNIMKFNKVCSSGSGNPFLFFIPMLTKSDRYAKKTKGNKAIKYLERWLIDVAISKNPGLINKIETHFLKNMYVTGIYNAAQGGSTTASKLLFKTLWRG